MIRCLLLHPMHCTAALLILKTNDRLDDVSGKKKKKKKKKTVHARIHAHNRTARAHAYASLEFELGMLGVRACMLGVRALHDLGFVFCNAASFEFAKFEHWSCSNYCKQAALGGVVRTLQ